MQDLGAAARNVMVPTKQVYGQIVGGQAPGQAQAQAAIPANVQPAASSYGYATSPSQSSVPVNPMVTAAMAAQSTQAQVQSAEQGMCPHCNQRAGKGKFCIECGKNITQAPAQVQNPMPQVQTQAQAQAPIQAVQGQPQAMEPGGHKARPGVPQPRYGGLDVTNRDAMPNKKPSMIPNASQVAQLAQRAQYQANAEAEQSFGPLSQRVAKETQVQEVSQAQPQAQAPAVSNQRQPVTSLTPDVSRLGLNSAQPGGVEF